MITGDPAQAYGSVRVADVVRAIRELEPGFHTRDVVRARYYALTGQTPDADQRLVAVVMRGLGLVRHVREGEKGWRIDPATLAERWPRLPWSE